MCRVASPSETVMSVVPPPHFPTPTVPIVSTQVPETLSALRHTQRTTSAIMQMPRPVSGKSPVSVICSIRVSPVSQTTQNPQASSKSPVSTLTNRTEWPTPRESQGIVVSPTVNRSPSTYSEAVSPARILSPTYRPTSSAVSPSAMSTCETPVRALFQTFANVDKTPKQLNSSLQQPRRLPSTGGVHNPIQSTPVASAKELRDAAFGGNQRDQHKQSGKSKRKHATLPPRKRRKTSSNPQNTMLRFLRPTSDSCRTESATEVIDCTPIQPATRKNVMSSGRPTNKPPQNTPKSRQKSSHKSTAQLNTPANHSQASHSSQKSDDRQSRQSSLPHNSKQASQSSQSRDILSSSQLGLSQAEQLNQSPCENSESQQSNRLSDHSTFSRSSEPRNNSQSIRTIPSPNLSPASQFSQTHENSQTIQSDRSSQHISSSSQSSGPRENNQTIQSTPPYHRSPASQSNHPISPSQLPESRQSPHQTQPSILSPHSPSIPHCSIRPVVNQCMPAGGVKPAQQVYFTSPEVSDTE